MTLKDILFEIEQEIPVKGDIVRFEYTCWQEDPAKPDTKGTL
jgi:hypothetical protein